MEASLSRGVIRCSYFVWYQVTLHVTWSQDDLESVDGAPCSGVVWKQNHAHIPVYKRETITCCWAKMRVIDVPRDISLKQLASNLRGLRSHGPSLGRTEMGPHDILPATSKLAGTGVAKVEQGCCQEMIQMGKGATWLGPKWWQWLEAGGLGHLLVG